MPDWPQWDSAVMPASALTPFAVIESTMGTMSPSGSGSQAARRVPGLAAKCGDDGVDVMAQQQVTNLAARKTR